MAIVAIVIELLLVNLFTYTPGVQYIMGASNPPWQVRIIFEFFVSKVTKNLRVLFGMHGVQIEFRLYKRFRLSGVVFLAGSRHLPVGVQRDAQVFHSPLAAASGRTRLQVVINVPSLDDICAYMHRSIPD